MSFDTILGTSGPLTPLGPETSESWTVSAEFQPPSISGLNARLSYYSIAYSDRLGLAVPNFLLAFSDPVYAPFVTLNPTAALQQERISSGTFRNQTAAAYDPANVYAIVDTGTVNLTQQNIQGIDAIISYSWTTSLGEFTAAANASWLDFRQELLPGSPEQQIDGALFNPPTWKIRSSLAWRSGELGASLFVNHISDEINPSTSPPSDVDDWTTVDLQLSYDARADGDGALHGFRLSLSAQNLFDADPPRVAASSTFPAGIGFDGANANAFGRVVYLTLTKDW